MAGKKLTDEELGKILPELLNVADDLRVQRLTKLQALQARREGMRELEIKQAVAVHGEQAPKVKALKARLEAARKIKSFVKAELTKLTVTRPVRKKTK